MRLRSFPSSLAVTEVRDRSSFGALRRARIGRLQTWTLVASALLLGLSLGAAGFVGLWRDAATNRDQVKAERALAAHRLHTARRDAAALGKRLTATTADLRGAKRQVARLQADLRDATGRASAAGREAADAQARIRTIEQQAKTVTSDLAGLHSYVANTPNRTLDSGFLLTQLEYVAAAARKIRAGR